MVVLTLVVLCVVEANTGREGRGVEEQTDSVVLPVGACDPAGDVGHVSAAHTALAFPQSTQRYRRVGRYVVGGRRPAGGLRRTP